jgi:hypothetical protein
VADSEKRSLVFRGDGLILMQGIGFLSDYLQRDLYNKARYSGLNNEKKLGINK